MVNKNSEHQLFLLIFNGRQSQVLSGRRWVWGRSVYVAGLRLDDGELLIVISSDSPTTMIAEYGARWGIETLFGMFAHQRILSRINPFY